MFIGAVGGIALSHLPGLPMIAGAAMGIGAMTVAMLGLPLVSVLLVTLFLGATALQLTPLVIVAVVVSYVVSARLEPADAARPRAKARRRWPHDASCDRRLREHEAMTTTSYGEKAVWAPKRPQDRARSASSSPGSSPRWRCSSPPGSSPAPTSRASAAHSSRPP